MHLDSNTVLSRKQVELGLYPAVDPLQSNSKALDPLIIGEKHYRVTREVQRILQKYKDLQDMIAILGVDELSEDDKSIVHRAKRIQKFLTQPLFVAEGFTGVPGAYVPLSTTIDDFDAIISGECDHMPEQAFYMVGTLKQARKKAEQLMS